MSTLSDVKLYRDKAQAVLDELNPMAEEKAEEIRKMNHAEFWKGVKRFNKELDSPPTDVMQKQLLEIYGISISITDDNNISPFYEIVDEVKYLMFVLKYAK